MLATLVFLVSAQTAAIDPSLASRYFQQAKALSSADDKKLWGTELYGPMFFADRSTHQIVANMADPQGGLKQEGDVWIGTLPQNINISNTAIDWSGRKWTMIAWPLSDLKYTRGRLLMHESFHRIQPDLGFHFIDLPSEHLDDLNGRTWMRLEMRALSEALMQPKDRREHAIQDVLTFRQVRQKLCGDKARNSERQLELNEGLAEYTGYKLSGLPSAAIPIRVASRLDSDQSGDSFARSFCYDTGPAYGLLLDDAMPDWRSKVKSTPIDELLTQAAKFSPPSDLETEAKQRALAYDGDLVISEEAERDQAHQQRIAEYKAKFIDGPVILFKPGNNFSFGFDPNAVDSFPGYGSVYSGARVTDDWGVLDATGDVLFVRANDLITEVRVAATAGKDMPLSGEGWTLKLNTGWKLVPGPRLGDWVMTKTG